MGSKSKPEGEKMNNKFEIDETEAAPLVPYPDTYQLLSMRVQRAYHDLRGRGYECYADLLCCQTCALSEVRGDRYVFWHGQNSESASEEGTLDLSWGGDGRQIAEALRAEELDVEWDGDDRKRIVVRLRHDAESV
jgi:hypothetical protein